MCGICGIYFHTERRPFERQALISMRDIMTHRGPDDSGIYMDESIWMGHRRLSIIDRAGSSQPMSNEDGSVWVTYNGEIYNYKEIRKHLLQKGHTFKTQGDTEVLVHLYEEFGAAFADRLNGIFAMAIWDKKANTLLLVRDYAGVKPVYYEQQRDYFAFASEIKSLLVLRKSPPNVNENVLHSYFCFGEVYGPQTMFDGIYELEPSCALKINCFGQTVTKYWDVQRRVSEESISEPEALEHLDAQLCSSVKMQMMSDVPLGVFLSGGVDSSVLLAYMTELSSGPIKTFSIGFQEPEANELLHARWVAQHFRTDHHEWLMDESSFLSLIPEAIWHHDEPIRYFSSIPLYSLSKLAKNYATVILCGEGADELFLGYRKYRLARCQTYLNYVYQKILPRGFWEMIASIGPKVTKRKVGSKVFRRLSYSPAAVALAYGGSVGEEFVRPILKRDWQDHLNQSYFEEVYGTAPVEGFLNRYAYCDLKTSLLSLLMKQDRMSMAASIETRVPFLDREMIDCAFSLPMNMKIRGNMGKYLLKKLAEKKIGNRNLIYRRKMGFPVPLTKWLKTGSFKTYLLDVLTDRTSVQRGIIDQDFLEKHLRDVESGIWGTHMDASELLWRILNFELWCRLFIDKSH